MSGSRGHIGWQKGERREAKEDMPSGKGTHWAEEGGERWRGHARQRRRRCRTVEWDPPAGEGERAHRRLLGRVFGAKKDAPSDLVGGGVCLAEKPYLVPKIRSPASPRPGTM